jgi:hypothetical protein
MKALIKEYLKKFLTGWDFMRILRLALSITMLFGYFSTKESLYLIGALFLGFQAILNMGCPGASCQTTAKDNETKPMQFKKLELKDDKKDV